MGLTPSQNAVTGHTERFGLWKERVRNRESRLIPGCSLRRPRRHLAPSHGAAPPAPAVPERGGGSQTFRAVPALQNSDFVIKEPWKTQPLARSSRAPLPPAGIGTGGQEMAPGRFSLRKAEDEGSGRGVPAKAPLPAACARAVGGGCMGSQGHLDELPPMAPTARAGRSPCAGGSGRASSLSGMANGEPRTELLLRPAPAGQHSPSGTTSTGFTPASPVPSALRPLRSLWVGVCPPQPRSLPARSAAHRHHAGSPAKSPSTSPHRPGASAAPGPAAPATGTGRGGSDLESSSSLDLA